jgi:rare lipoprotein A
VPKPPTQLIIDVNCVGVSLLRQALVSISRQKVRVSAGLRPSLAAASANHLKCVPHARPLGTRLQVTYRGLSTIVRINDRGPAANTGRALDLSRGAASDLGVFGAGDARVAIRVID